MSMWDVSNIEIFLLLIYFKLDGFKQLNTQYFNLEITFEHLNKIKIMVKKLI